MLRKMSENDAREFLRKARFGHLACTLPDGVPYVVPVNFLFDGNSIYVHSGPGQKITAMRSNPKVCLQTDEVSDEGFDWKSVIAFGHFQEITRPGEKGRMLEKFYQAFPRFTPVEAKLGQENTAEDFIVFRIKIGQVTGLAEVV